MKSLIVLFGGMGACGVVSVLFVVVMLSGFLLVLFLAWRAVIAAGVKRGIEQAKAGALPRSLPPPLP